MTEFIDWLSGALLWEAMRVASANPQPPSSEPAPFAALLERIERDLAETRACPRSAP